MDGMTIEDEGSSSSRGGHWEWIHFAQAAINSIGGSQGFGAFTPATYGVFEDTGWYTATLAEATMADYGFGAGCGLAETRECGEGWQANGVAPGYSLPEFIAYGNGSDYAMHMGAEATVHARQWPEWQMIDESCDVDPCDGYIQVCSQPSTTNQ